MKQTIITITEHFQASAAGENLPTRTEVSISMDAKSRVELERANDLLVGVREVLDRYEGSSKKVIIS